MSWTLIIIADGTRSMATIPGFQSEDAACAAGNKEIKEEVSFARYRVVEVPDPVASLGLLDRDLGEVPL